MDSAETDLFHLIAAWASVLGLVIQAAIILWSTLSRHIFAISGKRAHTVRISTIFMIIGIIILSILGPTWPLWATISWGFLVLLSSGYLVLGYRSRARFARNRQHALRIALKTHLYATINLKYNINNYNIIYNKYLEEISEFIAVNFGANRARKQTYVLAAVKQTKKEEEEYLRAILQSIIWPFLKDCASGLQAQLNVHLHESGLDVVPHVAIKWLIPDPQQSDSSQADPVTVTVARDSYSRHLNREVASKDSDGFLDGSRSQLHYVNKSSALTRVLGKVIHPNSDLHDCYVLWNDLDEYCEVMERLRDKYRNTNRNWRQHYNSQMVVPITHADDDKMLLGFVTVDALVPKGIRAFKEVEDLHIAQWYAALISIVVSLYYDGYQSFWFRLKKYLP